LNKSAFRKRFSAIFIIKYLDNDNAGVAYLLHYKKS